MKSDAESKAGATYTKNYPDWIPSTSTQHYNMIRSEHAVPTGTRAATELWGWRHKEGRQAQEDCKQALPTAAVPAQGSAVSRQASFNTADSLKPIARLGLGISAHRAFDILAY